MVKGLLDGLNEPQRAAVTAPPGPVLVLAGPGSGKTRVLTHRIAYLIGQMGIYPDSIMAVTFTNKAASEMRGRVQALLQGNLHGAQIGTFHAICARLLRREWKNTPYGADFVIFDTDDQVTLITQTLAELKIDTKKWNPRRVLHAISSAKNELVSPREYVAVDYFGELVARVYQHYQAGLLDNNALDFDDLLMQMVILLRENDTVSRKYQQAYEFLLVDEFQDTNTAQYALVKLLGMPQNNIFVVGDEDQAIYAFRGADYRNVLQFRHDYPQAKVILLEQNYRSTQVVLDAARAIIDKNSQRTPKALYTERAGGAEITVQESYNETYEAQFITETIEKLRRQHGYHYKDCAVMYRTNAQSRAIEEACVSNSIPYKLIGGVGFYKRREVRDLLAYLRLVNNPNDKLSFARVVNVPKRGIGQKTLQDFQQWTSDQALRYDTALDLLLRGEASPLGSKAARQLGEFGKLLRQWRETAETNDLVEVFDEIMSEVGYNLYLREISDNEQQFIERSENLRELRGLIAKKMEEGISLADFLAEQSLVADVDALVGDDDQLTLLTLHAAKGLEYPVVFIAGLEEGLLPHVRAFDEPDGMSEERRLMYVGLTRAKDHVYLTYAFRRSLWGGSAITSIPSRFLFDIPETLTGGLSPQAANQAQEQRFRQSTTWGESSLQRDLRKSANTKPDGDKIRSKIIAFNPQPALNYKSGQKVQHPKYGRGTVITSKRAGEDEEVTIAFDDKKFGVRTLFSSFGGLQILEEK